MDPNSPMTLYAALTNAGARPGDSVAAARGVGSTKNCRRRRQLDQVDEGIAEASRAASVWIFTS